MIKLWFDKIRLCAGLIGLLLSVGSAADAGILMEADWQGVPVKVEMAANFDRVRLEVDGRPYLLDAETAELHDLTATRSYPLISDFNDATRTGVPFRLRPWSNGPPVAGHRTRYNVLQVDELVCGEVLDSDWMAPFMANVVQALSVVQTLDDRLAPIDRGACGAAAFATYAKNGWPLVIGWRDAEIFRTHTLRFDHRPDAALLQLPGDTES